MYFLKKKSETFETFKKFKTMMEKMTGKNIRSMKSDKGGEYMSNEFNSYCENQRDQQIFDRIIHTTTE
jgi:hypothetical protein